MSIARKIFSNTAWQILGKAATAILGIVSIKFITNYLSRSTYGEYTTIYDYTALFAIVADFGLFTIAVREMAHYNNQKMIEKIVGNVLSIRALLAGFSLGLGVLVAFLIPAYQGSHIPFGIFIVSMATIITLLAGTVSSVLQFHLRMHWASIALTIGKFVTVFYIIFTVLYLFPNNPEAGFPHLLFAWIIGGLVTLLITFIASQNFVPLHFQCDFAFWKEVLLKALPYGLALVLGSLYFRMGTIILSMYNMKDQVGYFGVPLRFLEILQIIPHYFMNSVLPVLTMSLKEGSQRTTRVVKYSINALTALAFPIFVGGYLLAWPLTAAVSSPEFLTHRSAGGIIWGSDIGLKILLGAMVFIYLHVIFSYTLVAMGRQKELLWINGMAVFINIILNFLLIPRFGFLGAAASVLAAEAVMLGMLIFKIHSSLRGIWDIHFLAKTFFSAALMGLVLFLIQDKVNFYLASKSLFVLIPLGGSIFVISMLLSRALSQEMLDLLKKPPMPTEEKELGTYF